MTLSQDVEATITQLQEALQYSAQPLNLSIEQIQLLLQTLLQHISQFVDKTQEIRKLNSDEATKPLIPLMKNLEVSFNQVENFEKVADFLQAAIINMEDIHQSRTTKGLKKLFSIKLTPKDEEAKLAIANESIAKAVEILRNMRMYVENATGENIVMGVERKKAILDAGSGSAAANVVSPVSAISPQTAPVPEPAAPLKKGLVINAEDEESD